MITKMALAAMRKSAFNPVYKLGKAKSSVSDEIKLNSVKGIYTAKKAHAKAKQRRWRARWQAMKIPIDILLRNYVEQKIKQYWLV